MDAAWTRLSGDLQGTLIVPEDAEYPAARTIWNGAHMRRPVAIARVAGAHDIAVVLAHARRQQLPVCVRGGGHSAAGNAMVDGALALDLSLLRTVTVDGAERTAGVGGGALWADVDRATADLQLATPGGMISHTGVGGLTLGGGIGWLMRKHGLTIDNLIAADLVLADGREVTASATGEHAELFWGVRGGGGNFGVVTRFVFRLHPVSTVIAGMVMYPASRARAIVRFFRELTESAPDELTAMVDFLTAPPAPFVPAHLHGEKMIAIAACWSGDVARGEAALRPLRKFGPPAVDVIAEMPYVAWQSLLDPGAPHGWHYYMKAAYFAELTDDMLDALVEHATEPSSPLTHVHVHHLGGAVGRVAPAATAYSQRGAAYLVNLVPAWHQAADSEQHIAWTRRLYDAIVGFSNGAVYANFVGEQRDARSQDVFGENLSRLQRIKRAYDPDNVFRFNQNITPA